jgi:hypothetical protein
MKISEFKKLPKDAAYIVFTCTWRWKQRVETSFGTFGVEFLTDNEDDPDIEEPPDDEMLRLAEELVRYAKSHSEYIREIICGSYRYCATKFDPDWLESCEVPADLKPEQIRKYCNPILQVYRAPKDYDAGPPFECSIIVRPKWEPSKSKCQSSLLTLPGRAAKALPCRTGHRAWWGNLVLSLCQ